jgi:hypothetical protein
MAPFGSFFNRKFISFSPTQILLRQQQRQRSRQTAESCWLGMIARFYLVFVGGRNFVTLDRYCGHAV